MAVLLIYLIAHLFYQTVSTIPMVYKNGRKIVSTKYDLLKGEMNWSEVRNNGRMTLTFCK